MARDPRWGRNEETYGEDPHLTSRLGVAFVKGLQGDHPPYLKTVATIKHFVMNWQHRVVNSLEEAAALGVNSGCDLECGTTYKEKLVQAVEQGLISEAAIDRALTRVLTARFKLGEFDPMELVPYNHYDKKLLAGKKFAELAYEAAVKSVVLLKNDAL